MSNDWWHLSAAIVPSIIVTILFIFVIRAMISGDRRERQAEQRRDEIGHNHQSRIPTKIENKPDQPFDTTDR